MQVKITGPIRIIGKHRGKKLTKINLKNSVFGKKENEKTDFVSISYAGPINSRH